MNKSVLPSGRSETSVCKNAIKEFHRVVEIFVLLQQIINSVYP